MLLMIFRPPAAATGAPVADFSGAPVSGTAPLLVQFTDLSTGNPDTWVWDFGDGHTSTDQNPSHIYAAGTWTVSLFVSNSFGDDTKTRVDYITVTVTPIPSEMVCGFAGVIPAVAGMAMIMPALIVEGDAGVFARVAGTAIVPEC